MRSARLALALGAAAMSSQLAAQQPTISQTIAGTRLDVLATGEASRVPDVAILTAGVVSHAPSASAALGEAAARMGRMIAALKHSGIPEADIQTSNVSLNPEYRYPENQPVQLVGYSAVNSVTIRFRNIRSAGSIIDALVAQGANQINGPSLSVDRREVALDEARARAIAIGRARADLYARSLGMRVVRVVSLNETESGNAPPPVPMAIQARSVAGTTIAPGVEKLRVTLAMTFELQ